MPNVTVKGTDGDLMFEIDHTNGGVMTTITLNHKELCELRDKIRAILNQLAKNHNISSPKPKAYLIKYPKDNTPNQMMFSK